MTSTIALYSRNVSRALSKLRLIARNSDWIIPQFAAPVVIGRINYFGVSFSTVIEQALYVVVPKLIRLIWPELMVFVIWTDLAMNPSQ